MSLESKIIDYLKRYLPANSFVRDQIIIKEIPDALKPPKIVENGMQPDLPKKFDPSQAVEVTSNFEIDRQIKLKDPPDSLVMVNTQFMDFQFLTDDHLDQMKPIAAYLIYLDSLTIPGTMSKAYSLKKGFTSNFEASVDVKASVSGGIEGVCDASLEVTTGFEYDETMQTEETVTTTETLTEGQYCIFQNGLLYGLKITIKSAVTLSGPLYLGILNITVYPPKDKINQPTYILYCFSSCYRNDPFTIRYSDDLYSPLSYEELIDYVTGDGWDRW
ncbi:hypothetical protein CYY_007116 [Polysphondylium violaceum]|uniref:Monalysin Pore-forming domain-containing protein n=1 Tax=Polysphondylium violaceum TaxID=133409 RepID=A0A8J4V562_9MYCE|nr:hypothetical protein CYY_007116 [Polysphondylium violaceum]